MIFVLFCKCGVLWSVTETLILTAKWLKLPGRNHHRYPDFWSTVVDLLTLWAVRVIAPSPMCWWPGARLYLDAVIESQTPLPLPYIIESQTPLPLPYIMYSRIWPCVLLWNHSSWRPMFVDCQNVAGSWELNFMFTGLLYTTFYYLVKHSLGCQFLDKGNSRNP